MNSKPETRRGGVSLPLLLALLVAVLALGVGVGFLLRKGETTPEATSVSRTRPGAVRPRLAGRPSAAKPGGSPESPGAAAPGPGPAGPGEEPDPPVILKVTIPSDARTPADLMKTLREAAKLGDSDAIAEIETRLRKWLLEDPARTRELFDLFRKEADGTIMAILTGVLLSDPSVTQSAELAQGFLAVARDDKNADRRVQAVSFLAAVQQPSSGLVTDISSVARMDADPKVRQEALQALVQFRQTKSDYAGRVNDVLLDVLRRDADEGVRGSAVRSMDLYQAQPQTVEAVIDAGRADASPQFRAAAFAAAADAHPENRKQVVAKLEEAFLAERDPEVRLGLVTGIARAGRKDALQTLQRMADADPARREQIHDFVTALESGEPDFEQVWRSVRERREARGEETPEDWRTDLR